SVKCCAGACLDTSKDVQNCGACGKTCEGKNARATCTGGQCAVGTCNAGWGDCNNASSDGWEVTLRAAPATCTACGMTCSFAHAGAGCADRCYVRACDFGYDDCDGMEQNGCEKAVSSDPLNCGTCGHSCPVPPHARGACIN